MRVSLSEVQSASANFSGSYHDEPCIICGREVQRGETPVWVRYDISTDELVTDDETGEEIEVAPIGSGCYASNRSVLKKFVVN